MERREAPEPSLARGPDDLLIATVRTATLSAAGKTAIVEMCSSAHGVDFGELWDLLPPDSVHATASLGGELVGHAVITTRWLQPGGHPFLRCAYVDAVATAPAHQHRGIGSAVMRRLAATADAGGFEIGGLESELRGFYEPLGWQRWRGQLAGLTDAGLVPTPDQDGIFVLRLAHTPTIDIDAPLTIQADGRLW